MVEEGQCTMSMKGIERQESKAQFDPHCDNPQETVWLHLASKTAVDQHTHTHTHALAPIDDCGQPDSQRDKERHCEISGPALLPRSRASEREFIFFLLKA